MASEDQMGTLPLSVLTGRSSPSAEASKRVEIERDLRLSPLERVEKALRLGRELRAIAVSHGVEPSPRTRG